MRSGFGKGKLVLALIIAAISVFTYYRSTSVNPVTGEKQHVGSITPQQEIAMGLQAAPEMMQQFGGEDRDPGAQRLVEEVGDQVVKASDAGDTPYQYDFHALGDSQTVNAFALPGGQVFITHALLANLETRGELAGVLGHEIGHVVARHGAQQIAKTQLTQGLTGAAVIATYDPNNPSSQSRAAMAALLGQLITLKYGRDDELEADKLGVKFMAEAGYDPRSMIKVMEILKKTAGGRGGPDFFSTHPNPDNRIEKIQAAIKELYPNGVPGGLKP